MKNMKIISMNNFKLKKRNIFLFYALISIGLKNNCLAQDTLTWQNTIMRTESNGRTYILRKDNHKKFNGYYLMNLDEDIVYIEYIKKGITIYGKEIYNNGKIKSLRYFNKSGGEIEQGVYKS